MRKKRVQQSVIAAKVKGKVSLETVALTKRPEVELVVAELMLGLSLGVTRVDKIKNKNIRGTARVGRLDIK